MKRIVWISGIAALLAVIVCAVTINIYRLFPEFRKTERLLQAMRDGNETEQIHAARELGRRRDPASIEPLLLLLRGPSAKTRRNAVYGLRMMKDPRIFNAIQSALKDNDQEVREAAVRGIALSRDSRTLEVLYSSLFSDEAVAQCAAEALALMPQEVGIPMLIKAFETPDPKLTPVCRKAIFALYRSREQPPRLRQALLKEFRSGSSALRMRAVLGLRLFADTEVAEALLRGIEDPDPGVKYESVQSLDSLFDFDRRTSKITHEFWLRALPLLMRAKTPQALRDAGKKAVAPDTHWLAMQRICDRKDPRDALRIASFLREKDLSLQSSAASALAAIADPHTMPMLKKAVQTNKELSLSLGVFLNKLGDPQAWDALKQALAEPSVRYNAARILIPMKHQRAGELLAAEYERNAAGRRELLIAIKDAATPCCMDILVHGLKDKDRDLRIASVNALAVFQTPAAEDLLISYRKDPNIWSQVQDALIEMRSSKVVPLLIQELESLQFPANAVIALKKLADKRAATPLRMFFRKSKDAFLRADAVEALGRIGDRESIPELLEAIEDPSPRVRLSAAVALGLLKERKAVAALVGLLDYPNCSMREAAAHALGEIGDPRAIPSLAAHLSDISILKTVAEALSRLNWQPRTDREKTYMRLFQDKWQEIAADWPRSRAVFMKDLQSEKPQIWAGAAEALLAIGAEDVLKELINALAVKGKGMAVIAYNSGHSQLRNAAIRWAFEDGIDYNDLELYLDPSYVGSYTYTWGGHSLNTSDCCDCCLE